MLQQFHPTNFENTGIMTTAKKIIAFEAVPAFLKTLRARGKRVIQSHGIFDLIHSSHIWHVEEVCALRDVLVDTLIAETYVSVNDRIKTPPDVDTQTIIAGS